MRNIKFFSSMIALAVFFVSCTNEMDEWLGQDDQQTTMETRSAMTPISLSSELDAFTLNATNGTSTTGGFYWDQTYTNTKFQTSNFQFSHTAVSSWNYWDGFTISNVADTTNYGTYGTGGSNNWINHQWGCMAIPTGATSKPNFLVGYWSFYLDDQNPITATSSFGENKYSNWVKLGNNTQTFTVSKITVAIHPWTFYGIKSGDGFARPFVLNEHFDLIIYGVKADNSFVKVGSSVKSETHIMAEYKSTGLDMPTIWKDVAINFGEPIKYLVFQMYTSDEGDYGPNTAVYFCLRDIVMQ